ncbi:MAG: 50S ribosomal protein L13 [Candidatus Bilamarchaeaceae archaeon]
MMVVDGNNLIFGRMSTQVAKSLLKGEEVHVINCEKIVITGTQDVIMDRFVKRRQAQNKGTPEHSPHWPRTPNLLVRRMIRGMLPHKRPTGKAAFKRLRVYVGNPMELKPSVDMKQAAFDGTKKHVTILRVCNLLGYQMKVN